MHPYSMNLAHTDFSMHTTIREYHQLVDVSCTEVEVEEISY